MASDTGHDCSWACVCTHMSSCQHPACQGKARWPGGTPHAAEREADAVHRQQPERQEQRVQQPQRRVHRRRPRPGLRGGFAARVIALPDAAYAAAPTSRCTTTRPALAHLAVLSVCHQLGLLSEESTRFCTGSACSFERTASPTCRLAASRKRAPGAMARSHSSTLPRKITPLRAKH